MSTRVFIRTVNPWAVVANATLLSCWNPAWWQAGNPVNWSLVCEAFVYAMFPVVIRAIRPLGRWQMWAVTVLALGMVIAVPALNSQLPPFFGANSSPIARFPEFLLGVALGRMISARFWRGPRLWAAAVAVTGYIVDSVSAALAFTNVGYTVVGFAPLIAALARADVEGRRTIRAGRRLVHLGTLSFSFYLVHVLILQSIGSLWPGSLPTLPPLSALTLSGIALVISIAVAQVLHSFVEKPARRALIGPRKGKSLPGDVARRTERHAQTGWPTSSR